jgi:hypothetical protein
MKKAVIILIIILYALLTAGFIYYQYNNVRLADWLKFGTIVLSFLTIAFLWKDSFCRYDGTLVLAALSIIVAADIISIFHHRTNEILFVFMYIAVMLVLFARYNHKKLKNALILPLFLIIPAALYILSEQEWFFLHGFSQKNLAAVTVLYVHMLISVIASAVISVRRGRYPKVNAVLIITGLVFFCFGDICVALANVDLPREYWRMQLSFNRSIWIFYAPSKALLAFSAYNYAIKSNLGGRTNELSLGICGQAYGTQNAQGCDAAYRRYGDVSGVFTGVLHICGQGRLCLRHAQIYINISRRVLDFGNRACG